MISFVETGDETPEDAIVVLKDPQIEGDSLTYTVDMLEGSLPAKGELVSIFIDPFGRRSALSRGGGAAARRTVAAGGAAAARRRQRRVADDAAWGKGVRHALDSGARLGRNPQPLWRRTRS